jgi:hypothetical protein
MRAAHLDGVRLAPAVEQSLPLVATDPHLLRDVVDLVRGWGRRLLAHTVQYG